jgi:hypothetical protein
MTDAIGQELEKGDFVTAVWANGNVALFEVVDFKENAKTSRGYWARHEAAVVLKRLFNGAAKEETENKAVKKRVEQVTKVPYEVVRDYIIMFKLQD